MLFCAGSPAAAATTEVHVVRYAIDGTTVLDERTLNYTWMAANLPVMGNGITHYYHQGPVYVDDPDPVLEEEYRWNADETENIYPDKDMGAVKGTNLKDLCDLVGEMSPGEEVLIRASDGLSKTFAYENVYEYSSREGPMIITWYVDGLASYPAGSYPDTGYSDGMRLVWLADTSTNPWGVHAFGNWDWHEAAEPEYWYYHVEGNPEIGFEYYPTTTGLSVKYVSEILIYSDDPVPPCAQFTANVTSGTAPLTVQFTDQSTGSPSSWAWDFTNDGSTDSTSQNPKYTYSSPGTYTVNLTATNAGGSDSEIKTGYITVGTAPPVAQFTANVTSGTAPLTVQFTDQSTNSPTSWAWDFTNDGSVDSTTQNPKFTYSSPGTYTVNLTATNAGGSDSEIKTGHITVGVAPPVAQFTANLTSGTAPLTVQFTDQSTGSPTSWAWDFTNDGSVDSTTQNPKFTFSSPGTYAVKLTATNGGGSDSEIKTGYITVGTAPPVAQFTANTTSGAAPLTVQFTDQSTGSPTSWAWDFTNDGSADSTAQNPVHTYSSPGTYTVKLTATNAGGSDSEVKTGYITVGTPPPVAQFTANTSSGTAPFTVQFTDQSTGSPTSWAWDFTNDGSTDSTVQNPKFTYTSAGTYTVKLTATNAGGSDSEIKTGYITVRTAPPVAQFTANVTLGTAPLTVQFTDQSTGSPSSWAWDFTNDGSTDSTSQNPKYTYSTPGTYTVKLTATNGGGSDSEIKTGYITVTVALPVAQFTANVSSGMTPLNVKFTDQSTGYPTIWAWDFTNDGIRDSTKQNPTHTYSSPGTYTVKLTATNIGGSDSEIKTDFITVIQAPLQLPAFPGCSNSPGDLDTDSLYEDINGNGRLDFSDVVLYFQNMTWIRDNQLVSYFDYNGNGRIDFADVVRLFQKILPCRKPSG